MFHAPPEKYRLRGVDLNPEGSHNGAFVVPSPETGGWILLVICSDGNAPDAEGELGHWEHVSISVRGKSNGRGRIPNWWEMCFVKDLCWDPEDVVVQFHPKRSEYVNHHPHVLHLWRWKQGEFPTPPTIAVGPLET